MQFNIEGFRSHDLYANHGCCPVPVVMLFDSVELLTRKTTCFSTGNLAKRREANVGATAEFLKSIPFDKVFHVGRLSDVEKREIVFRRQAEIIIPEELDLTALRYVGCRTQAEYETLLWLLTPEAWKYGQST